MPAGRPKGSLNKATEEVKILARTYAPAALKELARLATKADSEQARVSAANSILDRAYGRPHQSVDMSHDVGDALASVLSEVAKNGRPRPTGG